jgi:hypothetical protein
MIPSSKSLDFSANAKFYASQFPQSLWVCLLLAQMGGSCSRAATARVWVHWAHHRPDSRGAKTASRPGPRKTLPFVFLGHGSARPLPWRFRGSWRREACARAGSREKGETSSCHSTFPISTAFIRCRPSLLLPSAFPFLLHPNLVRDRWWCGELGARRVRVGDQALSPFPVARSASMPLCSCCVAGTPGGGGLLPHLPRIRWCSQWCCGPDLLPLRLDLLLRPDLLLLRPVIVVFSVAWFLPRPSTFPR